MYVTGYTEVIEDDEQDQAGEDDDDKKARPCLRRAPTAWAAWGRRGGFAENAAPDAVALRRTTRTTAMTMSCWRRRRAGSRARSAGLSFSTSLSLPRSLN